MDRAYVIQHLANQFGPLAAVVDLSLEDTSTGAGAALDQALRVLGYTSSELATATVDDDAAGDYLALAEYYLLVRLNRYYALSVDEERDTATGKRKRSGMAAKVAALLADARTAAIDLGYIAADTGFQMGRINLDFIEPAPTEFG